MALSAITQFTWFWVRRAAVRLGEVPLASRLAAAASLGVACIAVYLTMVVSGQIRQHAVQKAGTAAALYMDSFVAAHVQELATKDTLSTENREALERLLAPAAMHRPVIAFRIWKGDTIVFSNERALIGKTFSPTNARERALQGEMGVDFEHPDGDDDVQVRSLNVPVLEVYAPVRQKGTGRIIAIAETYELAVLLTNEVWTDQLTTWASAGAIVLMIDLLLFNMLSRLRVESDQQRRRLTHANMRVGEKNEDSLRSVEAGLREGPIQNVTLALLKLDPFHPAVRCNNETQTGTTTQFIEDMVAAREALSRTIALMREVCTASVPARVAELSVREALAAAAREHQRRTGLSVQYDFDSLPDQLPSFLKVCLYRILLEGLRCTAGGAKSQLVRGSVASNRVALEIVGTTGGKDHEVNLASVRDRIEALGGTLEIHSADHGQLSLAAEVNLADLGTANV